jgi:hypothetical protein
MRAPLLLACALAACGTGGAGGADAAVDAIALPDGQFLQTCNDYYTVVSAADLSAIDDCQVIYGLEINGLGSDFAVHLPLLQRVEVLRVYNQDSVDLPALTSAWHVEIQWGATDLQGFRNLATVEGMLQISGNPNLTSLAGLDNLTSLGVVVISENALASVEPLRGVTTANAIAIFENSLTSVDGFDSVTNLAGGLSVGGDTLVRIGGFSSLAHTGGLSIMAPALTQLDAFRNLTQVDGDLTLITPSLTAMPELENVTSIRNLRLAQTGLTSLWDLRRVEGAAGAIWIDENPALTTVAGLEGLTSADSLRIESNPVLADLAFTSLELLTGPNPSFQVTWNAMLDFCPIEALLLRLQTNGFAGTAQIYSNASDSCP